MLELPLTLAGQGWHHEACAAAVSARAGFGRDFRSRLFGTERICALVVSPVRARSCSPASERGGRSPQERAKRSGNQRVVSPIRACSCSPASERDINRRYRRYGCSGSGTVRQANGNALHISKKSTTPGAKSTGEPVGEPLTSRLACYALECGASQKSPSSPIPAFSLLERSGKKQKRLSCPALRVGFFAVSGGFLRNLTGTGALVRRRQASGVSEARKSERSTWGTWRMRCRTATQGGEARRRERSARAISGRYRRYGRAHAHRQASGAGKARRSERAGIPRLKTCFTLLGCAKPGAIAGETLSIYTRSAPIMIIMIVVMALASHGPIGAAAAQGVTAIVAYCVDRRSGGCDFRPHRQDAFASPCSDQGRDDG